ncbi:MAG: hypothetical protein ACOYOP_14475 [Microthrixaceae bacterium]
MAETTDNDTPDTAKRFIENLEKNEDRAIEAVREFVDTVDGAFPAVGEDGPRRRIIDAAFKMTEQLVGASNQLALNIVDVTEKALAELEKKGTSETV